MLKFNMGCGHKKKPGWVNVDSWAGCAPDAVCDLEQTPWPWAENCADEILFHHSLEHLGGDPKTFLAIMSEIYRIAADACVVQINVPHPRHDNFLSDPTHVRPITPGTLDLFDANICAKATELGGAQTPLAFHLGVDFERVHTGIIAEEPYLTRFQSGELSREQFDALAATQNNIVRDYRFTLRAHKPARASDPATAIEAEGVPQV